MRASYKYLVLATVLAISVHTVPAEGMPSDDSIEKILRDRLDLYKKSVGIVVGIIDSSGRKVVAYGKTDLKGDTQVGANTVFEIGSVSKVFTGTLLADAVKRGELRLEDPVSRFLPEAVTVPSKDGKEITLLDLATHRSGLPRMPTNFKPANPQNPFADYTVENMYEFLCGYSLTRPVGEAFEYSNLGVGLLGHVLSLNAGVDYETLVRTRICGPLGMESTVIHLTPDLHKRMATGHTAMRQPTPNWDIPTFAGAGAIRSTTEDMLRFLAANMALVETDLRDAMDAAHSARLPAGRPEMEIGFGWLTHKKHESEIVWHNGGTGGYHSFVGWDRKTGLGVVVLSNSKNDIDDIGRHLINPAFELAKLELPKERKEIALGAEIYESYVGEYEVVPTFVLTVTHEPVGLYLQVTGQPKSRILAEAETEFFSEIVDVQISFRKDESGQLTHLVLHQGGQDVKAMRRGAIVPDEESMQWAPESLDRYVGKYELVPGFVISITNESGQLLAQATGQPAIPIYPESETRFVYRVVDAQIEFQLDDAGVVKGLTLFQGGRLDRSAHTVPRHVRGTRRTIYEMELEPIENTSRIRINTGIPAVGRLLLWVPEAITSNTGISSIYPIGTWEWNDTRLRQHVSGESTIGPGIWSGFLSSSISRFALRDMRRLGFCVFRSKVATRFGLKWPPNSEQSGHLFRSESGRFLAAAETGGRHVPK